MNNPFYEDRGRPDPGNRREPGRHVYDEGQARYGRDFGGRDEEIRGDWQSGRGFEDDRLRPGYDDSRRGGGYVEDQGRGMSAWDRQATRTGGWRSEDDHRDFRRRDRGYGVQGENRQGDWGRGDAAELWQSEGPGSGRNRFQDSDWNDRYPQHDSYERFGNATDRPSHGRGFQSGWGGGEGRDYPSRWGMESGAGYSGRGPKGYTRSDERILEDVCERLTREDVDAGDVEVQVRQGKVTLSGTVGDRWSKHRIEDIADACSGVQDVRNDVSVSRGSDESRDAPSGDQKRTASGATASSGTRATASSGKR